MQISAQYLSGDQVTAVWYKASSENDSGTAIDDSAIINSNGTSGAAAGEYETITSTLTYDISTAGTSYYYCIVTVSRNGLTGTSSAQAISDRARIELTTATINDFTVTFKNDGTTEAHGYLTPGTQPTFAMMTITETWSDGIARSASEADYTFTLPSGWDASCVGSYTVTASRSGTDATCSVPYKYTMMAPEGVSVSFTDTDSTNDAKVAQYTGSTVLTASCGSFTTYTPSTQDYSIKDDVTYQWYSAATEDGSGTLISGATNATYTPSAAASGTVWYYAVITTKCSGGATYCANSTDTLFATTDRTAVTVTPWTLSLTDTTAKTDAVSIANGGSVQIVAGHSYSMQFTNAYADSTSIGVANNSAYVTWASTSNPTITPTHDDTNGGWTFTAPAATTSVQTVTLTSSATAITNVTSFGAFTVTVPAKEATGTTEATFADLKAAVENLTSGQSGTFIIPSTFTTATTDTATITITGNITIIAASSGTSTITRLTEQKAIALFTVATSGTLTLGDTGGSLVIDGGSITSATQALISCSGCLTIGKNCTLQNNHNSSTTKYGGAIYCSGSTSDLSLNVYGTIKDNFAAKRGGAIDVEGSSTYLYSVTLSGCTITGNTASSSNGGALFMSNVSGTISASTLTGNKATGTSAGVGGGGAIYLSGSATGNSVEIKDKTVIGTADSPNTAGTNGGGIYINGGTLTLTNGTISGNTATTGSNVYLGSGSYIVGTTTNSTASTAFDAAQSN